MRRIPTWLLSSLVFTFLLVIIKGLILNQLNPSYIQENGAYPYAVLGLCALLLYSKRNTISLSSLEPINMSNIIMGLSLVLIAFILPANGPALQIFTILLIWVGFFTIFFGSAAELPLALEGVYGFAIAFPLLINKLGSSFPLITTKALVRFLNPLIPISNTGQSISFMDTAGGSQSYFIDASCSGSAALSIFLSIFFLMLIDTPLPGKKAVQMLIFGLIGTSLQNILRLSVLVLAGYLYGSSALWSMHTYAGYVIFPIWYAVFVYVYLRQARGKVMRRSGGGPATA